MITVAVVGIGNSLLSDDGAGIHALRRFAADNTGPGITCIDGGTVGLALMDRIAGHDGLVVIDALKSGRAPATITVLEAVAMDAHIGRHHGSVHEVGLSDLVDALRLCGALPRYRALVGIEPECMDWGTEPTRTVAAAIPRAAERVRRLVAAWQAEPDRDTAA